MPLFSDTASAIKSRFGFHDRSSSFTSSSSEMLTVKSTPDLSFKSAAKDVNALAVRSFSESGGFDDDDDDDKKITPAVRSFEFQEDPNFWKEHNVQVIIRVRPLNSSEISLQGNSRCIKQDSSQTITWTGHPESRFTFDLVADENVSQEMLFKVAGVPMVENCMGGYNSCMFAYGQTGSGKTHTMLGDIEGGTRRHSVNCGMTPRVFEYLFSRIQKEREVRREEKIRHTCRCSFLEIYNEQILDLLDPTSLNLQIREDHKKGIYVENLTEIEVTSARDVIQQLLQGATNRKVAATNMNHASSRSHSVFTCTVESTWESQGVTHHRFARLNLVDLAGSERQKSSGAEGERLKEATNINKSLSTLGLVIMNLVNISNGKSLHVPYRDSKLTFLLQESLGGNAKTSIIANISPSSCCSLETLSTLKFAQRAKYIKNHAIVNEDASGDVLAMRIQIQNLKKEVSRLRSLVNGGAEHNEIDTLAAACPGSPGSFKWEGLQGLSSPLASAKKITHKKEYEVALVGAFRREKEKDTALQAMTAESQAASKLAKQREDEIKSLKMRLRFREAGIKRLEAIASGKISAETHLLKEREEHLKEIEVLSTQVDRNQEVTRFAMENLRLKEEIRRLKSFCEEGERERMNEQIVTLQNKLLEALDWKLMHESDPMIVQKQNSELNAPSGDDFLLSSQASPWRTSMNEENEFLRMQAIQNQSELDSLHKKLNSCVEEKEKLQRHVNDLLTQLEVEKSSRADEIEEARISGLHSLTNNHQMPSAAPADQKELETMVDAIAAASQREAEAHETAIFLSKENDELKMKLKVMIEDNNRLIELYEGAVEENHNGGSEGAQITKEQRTEQKPYHYQNVQEEEHMQMEKEIENLKHQLLKMHEENDNLMGLYEKAMQEKDELKRVVVSNEQNTDGMRVEFNCPGKLVEMDGAKDSQSDKNFSGAFFENFREAGDFDPADSSKSCDAVDMPMETSLYEVRVEDECCDVCVCRQDSARPDVGSPLQVDTVDNPLEDGTQELDAAVITKASGTDLIILEANSPESQDVHFRSKTDSISSNAGVCLPEAVGLFRKKLVETHEKLLDSAQIITTFALLERVILEVDELSQEIERIESGSQVKQQEYASSKVLYSEIHEKKIILCRKLTALRYSLSNFSSSIKYFEQREYQVREKMNASFATLDKKKEELVRIQACKDEILDAQMKLKQSEVELKNGIAHLKLREEEETQRIENERILFAIENVEHSSQNWRFSGKATELLKSEEQKTKLQNQIKQALEKLGVTRKEIEEMNTKLRKLDLEIQHAGHEIENASLSVEELDHKLQSIIKEKEMILDMTQNGRNEYEAMILDYHQCLFETQLKEEEIRILEEDLRAESTKLGDLKRAKSEATSRTSNLLVEISCHSSCLVSDKLGENFHQITNSVAELNSLLSMTTL